MTYSQTGEDAILMGMFTSPTGFYVDVGANDPELDSVSKVFYDRGWSGINIEPIPMMWRKLCEHRPRDVNLNFGVADYRGELTFWEFPELPGLSTFDPRMRDEALKRTQDVVEHTVKVETLAHVFDEHVGSRHIDWLKVDAEGLDGLVIAGNNWSLWKPTVVVVEVAHVNKVPWEARLRGHGYVCFHEDALNCFYRIK